MLKKALDLAQPFLCFHSLQRMGGSCPPLSLKCILECSVHFAGPHTRVVVREAIRWADPDSEFRAMMSVGDPLGPQESEDMHPNPQFPETVC